MQDFSKTLKVLLVAAGFSLAALPTAHAILPGVQTVSPATAAWPAAYAPAAVAGALETFVMGHIDVGGFDYGKGVATYEGGAIIASVAHGVGEGWNGGLTRMDAAGNVVYSLNLDRGAQEFLTGVQVGPDGSAIAAGFILGNSDFEWMEMWILKVSPSGETVWEVRVPVAEEVNLWMDSNVVLDDAGNAYTVVGTESVDAQSRLDYEALVAKITPDGELAWAKPAGLPDTDEVPRSIARAPNGDVLLIGYDPFGGEGDNVPVVVRLDSDGNLVDRRAYEMNDGRALDAVVAPDGSVYVSGVSENEIAPPFFEYHRGFVMKLTPGLDLEWRQSIVAGDSTSVSGMTLHPDEGVLVTGCGDTNVDPNEPGSSQLDAVLAHVDALGVVRSMRTIATETGVSECGMDVVVTPDGEHAWVAGSATQGGFDTFYAKASARSVLGAPAGAVTTAYNRALDAAFPLPAPFA